MIHNIYLVLPSLEMQKRLIQTKVCYSFFTLSEKMTYKHSIDATCFDEYFLFHITFDNWKTLFFVKVFILWKFFMSVKFFSHIIAFFQAGVLKYVCILRYFHNNSAVLIPKFQNKASFFTIFYFINVPHFSL